MTSRMDMLLDEALSMSPAERAMLAHCLIASIDSPNEKNFEQEWLNLAQKRLDELDNQKVTPISWDELKQKIKRSAC